MRRNQIAKVLSVALAVTGTGFSLNSGNAHAAGCTISSPVGWSQTSGGVACVEQTLKAAGYQSTYVDSYYGTVTVASVAAFQRGHGLPVNGNLVDAATASAMGIWTGPAPLPAPPPAPRPAGCLQTAGTVDANGVRVVKPGTYQTVAYAENPAGTRGDVVVVGDSLTWMTASDTAKALAQAGFRRVCVDGTISRTVEFGTVAIPDGLHAVARIKASDPSWASPDVKWVFALGTNDVGFSTNSSARALKYIGDQIAAVGPHNQPIAWVNVHTARSSTWQTREYIFNKALVDSGLQVIDWASQFTRGEVGGDLVHFTVAGKAARVGLLAAI